MPRKAKSVLDKELEPNIKVLTSEDIKQTFNEIDYLKIIKKSEPRTLNELRQHSSIWMQDESGEFQVIIKDKAYSTCTYLGSFEGAKFEVVLAKNFFDSVKSIFVEKFNENNINYNKCSFNSTSNLSYFPKKTEV